MVPVFLSFVCDLQDLQTILTFSPYLNHQTVNLYTTNNKFSSGELIVFHSLDQELFSTSVGGRRAWCSIIEYGFDVILTTSIDRRPALLWHRRLVEIKSTGLNHSLKLTSLLAVLHVLWFSLNVIFGLLGRTSIRSFLVSSTLARILQSASIIVKGYTNCARSSFSGRVSTDLWTALLDFLR